MFDKLFGWLGKETSRGTVPITKEKAATVEIDDSEQLEFLSNFVKSASVKKAISQEYAAHLKSKYGADAQNFVDALLGSQLLVEASIEASIVSSFSLAELKTLAKDNGLPESGRKLELAGRVAPLDLHEVNSRILKNRIFSCADGIREQVEKHIRQKHRLERDAQWAEYNRLIGVYAQAGDWEKYALIQKNMAEQLLEENKNEQALMHASVALFIAANGPNYLNTEALKILNDPLVRELDHESSHPEKPIDTTWAPGVNSRVMPHHLRPFLEASQRLELQGDALKQAYLNACQRLFKHTFGAPLSYAEAWQTIINTETWDS